MKKQICLLFFISVTIFEGMCTSPQNKVDSIESIRQAYNNCDYEVFFHLFPNSYSKFIEYYGYIKGEPMPLYFEAHKHIEYLVSGEICKRKLLEKLIEIAKDGIWEADAPNFLRKALNGLIMEYPGILLQLLKEKNSKEIKSFWSFILYYPSLHPENDLQYKENFRNIYTVIAARDVSMGRVISDIYDTIVNGGFDW